MGKAFQRHTNEHCQWKGGGAQRNARTGSVYPNTVNMLVIRGVTSLKQIDKKKKKHIETTVWMYGKGNRLYYKEKLIMKFNTLLWNSSTKASKLIIKFNTSSWDNSTTQNPLGLTQSSLKKKLPKKTL